MLQNLNAAHSLYVLFETLPDATQQLFIQELLEKQAEKVENHLLYLACQQAREENDFLDDSEAQSFIDNLAQ